MPRTLRLFAVAAMLMFAASAAGAAEGLIVKTIPHSVGVTLDRLEAAIKKAGARVFARIDHGKGAASIGQDLRPTQLLIFGNPKMGTPLLQSAQPIGLDLPLRVVAWEDAAGKVHIAYNDPAHLAKRYGITDRDKVFAKMSGALGKLTGAAIKP